MMNIHIYASLFGLIDLRTSSNKQVEVKEVCMTLGYLGIWTCALHKRISMANHPSSKILTIRCSFAWVKRYYTLPVQL